MFIRARGRVLVRPRLAFLVVAAAAGAALPAAGIAAGPAGATPNPSCTGFPAVVCVFSATGSAITWPIPAGVTSLTVTAAGGQGANASSTFVTGGGSGGLGGIYQATLTGIPSGTSLSVFPGSAGNGASGGVNASGNGGNSSTDTHSNTGGGGGGATTVAISPFSVASILVAAGGGGGGSAENQASNTPGNGGVGGGSGTPSGTDGDLGSPRGHGGTTTAGGAGGANACATAPHDGTQLNGGNGQTGSGCGYAGGGGGSGYFGGGGGGTGGGGGGGSAFPAATTTVSGITVTPIADSSHNSGDGSVTIAYTATVERTRLRVWGEHTGDTITLHAHLTGDGQALQSQPVKFGRLFATLCSSVLTNSSGYATCPLSESQTDLVQFWFGYINARYAGIQGLVPPAFAQAFVEQRWF
jgi:hypothetical protein